MKKIIVVLTVFASFFITSPTHAYTVNSGDTISKITREHNGTLEELANTNPQITNLDWIYVDQTVNTMISNTTIEANTIQTSNFETSTHENTSISESEIDLLARLVRAEAQTEPFEGKVAVACVVLNRVESPQFPDTIREVIYAPGQFQPVQNGQINKPADEESIKAVKVALTEQRQVAPGALFFYNPAIATSRWLDSRTTTLVIGQHVFKK